MPIKQHLDLETTLLALQAGSTDSLSQDSGKTGSLDDGTSYFVLPYPYPCVQIFFKNSIQKMYCIIF